MQLLRLLVIGALACSVDAQWGRKKNKEGAAAMRDEFEAEEKMRAEQAAAASAAGAREYELENLASAPQGNLNSLALYPRVRATGSTCGCHVCGRT